jgi:cob(I)alamin adenosyltransferase
MTEQTENLVLEILRKLQEDVADMRREMREEFRDVKLRLSLLEHHFATHTAEYAHQNERIDRMEQRIERIERRLELRDTE